MRALDVAAGNPVTFSVTADGTMPFSYQWQKGGANISGANAQTYQIAKVQASDAGNYTVIVSNNAGSTTSNSATLTVAAAVVAATAPAITTQPAAASATIGGTATFTVAAAGNPTPTFQWYIGGTALSGATSATLTLNNVQLAAAGSYYATATNSAGSVTSSSATLTVSGGPASTQIVTAGHEATFTGAGAPTGGQWQVSTDGGGTWSSLANDGNYSGVSSTTLTIAAVNSTLNGYRYRYSIAGSTGTVAVLTVAAAVLPFPVGIAADAGGNLWVTDTSTDVVSKVVGSGTVSPVAGFAGQSGTIDGTGTAARFNNPVGIVVAADGTLSVADSANATIRRISPAGLVSTLAGSTTTRGNADGTGSAATFSSPLGLALDLAGNLYVADALNNTIRKVTPAGVVTTLAGTAGATGSADGTGSAARFNHPTGLASDGAGNVYVADATNNTIRRITPAGVVSTLAGLPGVSGFQDGTGGGALFNNPGGLAVDGAGNLYLADTGNSTIRRITPAGVVATVAGLPGIAGLIDGSGSAAWFNQPQGVALDSAGNLYVTDTGNAALRKITPAGLVSTVALTASSSGPTPADTSGGTTPAIPAGSTGTTSGGGGGGGAVSSWFAGALALVCLVRRTIARPRAGLQLQPGISG